MKISHLYYEGRFGLLAATQAAALLGVDHSPMPVESLDERQVARGSGFAVFLSMPRLLELKTVGQASGTVPWIAAFPFERHLVITPTFGIGAPCAECFVKRWLSQPPDGYQHEIVLASVRLAQENRGVEYRNLNPLAAAIAARLLVKSTACSNAHSICFDTASLQIDGALIRSLHGCSCRVSSIAHGNRFSSFGEEFTAMLATLTPVEPSDVL